MLIGPNNAHELFITAPLVIWEKLAPKLQLRKELSIVHHSEEPPQNLPGRVTDPAGDWRGHVGLGSPPWSAAHLLGWCSSRLAGQSGVRAASRQAEPESSRCPRQGRLDAGSATCWAISQPLILCSAAWEGGPGASSRADMTTAQSTGYLVRVTPKRTAEAGPHPGLRESVRGSFLLLFIHSTIYWHLLMFHSEQKHSPVFRKFPLHT